MEVVTIKRLYLTLDAENAESEARDVIHILRPTWADEQLRFTTLSRDHVHLLLCCYLVTDVDQRDALVLRIYIEHFEWTIEKEAEVAGFALAHKAGCGTPIHAVFNNGIVYGYAMGRPLTYHDCFDPNIANLAGQAIARFNSMDPHTVRIVDDKGHEFHISKPADLMHSYMETLDHVPESFQDIAKTERFRKEVPCHSELQKELMRIKEHVENLDVPVVIGHNDFYFNNIIYDETTESIHLIDLEATAHNMEPADVATIKLDRSIFRVFGLCKEEDPEMDKATLLMWLRPYLETRYEAQGRSAQDVTKSVLEHFYVLVKTFATIDTFLASLCFFSLVDSENDAEDWFEAGIAAMKSYYRQRHELFLD